MSYVSFNVILRALFLRMVVMPQLLSLSILIRATNIDLSKVFMNSVTYALEALQLTWESL